MPVTKSQALIDDAPIAFKTRMAAYKYLTTQGYSISYKSFLNHCKQDIVPVDQDGLYRPSGLMEYARARLKSVRQAGQASAGSAQTERVKADAELKRVQAERAKLKLEAERGLLIEREKHEISLAARAAFFRREVETLGLRLGPSIVGLVRDSPDPVGAFNAFWAESTEAWMDAWDSGKEFAVDLDLEELSPGLLTSGRKPGRGRPRKAAGGGAGKAAG
jgi:hypothetical protein